MIIQQINKNSPPKADVVVTNAAGATITLGYAASYTTTAASLDGNKVVLPAASQVATFAGIAVKNIPDNEIGRVRAYGYHQSVFIFATGTSVTNAIAIAVGPGVAGSNGVNSTGLKDFLGPVVLAEAVGAAINSPGGYAKAFVRAL
jgi:hypothetical protein